MTRARHIAAVLPLRRLDNAKTRLAAVLSPAERRDLSLNLLLRALDALAGGGVERVAIVTADGALPEAVTRRATILYQDEPGLNAALRDGQAWALAGGYTSLLIVLPDLPLVAADDIRAMLDASAHGDPVIATDRHGAGTNAMLLTPPDAITPAFGEGSAARHRVALAAAGLPVISLYRPALGLDLDTPEDLAELSVVSSQLSAISFQPAPVQSPRFVTHPSLRRLSIQQLIAES